jgi:acetoin:2,6-dichlorophenolindophenol oxidoreductase subunit beta
MNTVLDSLNTALHKAMEEDPSVVLLGEDILDPYGGAFRVTRGLSSAFPERVLTTPISEAGIVGIAAGMAMRGLRPVVEIMFGDFLTLAADQLINHASKFRWMYNDQVRVPMVVRTPMGGRRGYGPTHSQTLEKHFLGVPGLRVLAPTSLIDPCELLKDAILRTEDPVLFIENKLLYLMPVNQTAVQRDFDIHNHQTSVTLALRGAPQAELTLASYGYAAGLAQQAVLKLAYEHEIFCELVVLTQLAPFELSAIYESASSTKRLLSIEEGGITLGWGAEITAQTAESLGPNIMVSRVAARDLPIPSSGQLETQVLPGIEDIISAALKLAGRK